MKQFNWRIFNNLESDPNIDYINSCCEFCDLILEKIKAGIGRKMNAEPDEFIIEQEDWGWLLEFQREELLYLLSISYREKDEENAHNFGVVIEVKEKKSGFFFNRHIENENETEKFAKIAEAIAKEQDFEVTEE